jgi:hypothetical protein
VDPVADPLVLRRSGSPGNGTQTYGYLARNSDPISQRRSFVSEQYLRIEFVPHWKHTTSLLHI